MNEKRSWRRVSGAAWLGVWLAATGSLYGCSTAAPVTFDAGSPEELRLAEELGVQYLGELLAGEGVDARRDFIVQRVLVDELSMAHARVQQVIKGVPVLGGEAIVHMNRDGSLFALTDDRVRGIPVDLDVIPAIPPSAAEAIVLGAYECVECLTAPPVVDLRVLRRDPAERPRLVYRVQLRREDGSEGTGMPVVFIDAGTGEEVWRYDNLQTATGSGASLYSGKVSVATLEKDGSYYLEDTTRGIGTFDNKGTTGSTSRFQDANNSWTGADQRAGVEAHHGAAKVYDYYKDVHGRIGIDSSGGPGYYTAADGKTELISSKVHYSRRYNNAFWNGSFMTYGDGDGEVFSPLVSLDICGHEMTHGITERTAGLLYAGESGALNESMSDVFGAMVERYAKGESASTWKIGEQCYTPGTDDDALRHMDNPHLATNYGYTANDDPDHYSERYVGKLDNGGVHINSGIPNKAFYLVAKGGSHHLGGSMVGIGADDAARIWYKALTTYMTSSTSFAGARAATLNAATALFGSESAQRAAVAKAWTLVGVGSGDDGGACGQGKCAAGDALANE